MCVIWSMETENKSITIISVEDDYGIGGSRSLEVTIGHYRGRLFCPSLECTSCITCRRLRFHPHPARIGVPWVWHYATSGGEAPVLEFWWLWSNINKSKTSVERQIIVFSWMGLPTSHVHWSHENSAFSNSLFLPPSFKQIIHPFFSPCLWSEWICCFLKRRDLCLKIQWGSSKISKTISSFLYLF